MEEEVTFNNTVGLRLAGILSRPTRRDDSPIVVLCHGFNSDKNSHANRSLVPRLDELGIASLRFDFMGQGDSEGDIACVTVSSGVDDLRAAIESLEAYPWLDHRRVGLFAASYGGNVALWYAADCGGLTAIVLQAPVSDYAAQREQRLGAEGIRQWKEQGYTFVNGDAPMVRTNYTFYEDAKTRNTYELVKGMDAKCLVFHGGKDDSVPLDQSRALVESIGPQAQLQIIPNADHTFEGPDEMERVVEETAHFLRVYLMPTT